MSHPVLNAFRMILWLFLWFVVSFLGVLTLFVVRGALLARRSRQTPRLVEPARSGAGRPLVEERLQPAEQRILA